jgi:hypothetical protein
MLLLRDAGKKVHEITSCRNYEEYQEMAESAVYISYNADARPGGDMLAARLGGKHHYLRFSFDFDEIDDDFARLADELGVPRLSEDEIWKRRVRCLEALTETRDLIGDTPVAIDYTYCPRPLGLARLLLDHGFNVARVYLDGIPAADKPDFELLREHHPDLMLHPTVHAGMRFAASENSAGSDGAQPQVIAVGQKAAYFENTDNFVNVVEGGGMIGYEAVIRTCELIQDAYNNTKDMRDLVQVKGLGCEVCLR